MMDLVNHQRRPDWGTFYDGCEMFGVRQVRSA